MIEVSISLLGGRTVRIELPSECLIDGGGATMRVGISPEQAKDLRDQLSEAVQFFNVDATGLVGKKKLGRPKKRV